MRINIQSEIGAYATIFLNLHFPIPVHKLSFYKNPSIKYGKPHKYWLPVTFASLKLLGGWHYTLPMTPV